MYRRNIFVVGLLALTVALALAGPGSAKPVPSKPIAVPAAPDLVERYVERQPASAYYTPAALRASGLRLQSMARTYERQSKVAVATSGGFDTRDALIGAAGCLALLVAAGLLFAKTRVRRPHVAL
jgi:hypothetical protein